MSIAFFDVDGTLMSVISGFYTTLELMRRGIIKKRRLPMALFYKLVASLYTGNVRRMYEVAIADMAGSRLDDILEIGREVFERHLKPKIYREALEEIERHRRQGHKIILLSSGPTMAITIVQEFVKADGSYSIGPAVEDNILQNRLQEPFTYKEGKILAAGLEAKKAGVTLKECYFYADSHHDIHLLSAVGNPRVVNPDRRLGKIAAQKGWPVLQFKTLLGEKNN